MARSRFSPRVVSNWWSAKTRSVDDCLKTPQAYAMITSAMQKFRE
jgi:hypothetical protein